GFEPRTCGLRVTYRWSTSVRVKPFKRCFRWYEALQTGGRIVRAELGRSRSATRLLRGLAPALRRAKGAHCSGPRSRRATKGRRASALKVPGIDNDLGLPTPIWPAAVREYGARWHRRGPHGRLLWPNPSHRDGPRLDNPPPIREPLGRFNTGRPAHTSNTL